MVLPYLLIAVSGCRLPPWTLERADSITQEIESTINQSRQIRNLSSPRDLIRKTSNSWIGPNMPIRTRDISAPIPEQLKREIQMTFVEEVTLGEIGRLIATETGQSVTIAPDIQNTPVSNVDWSGPAHYALNYVTGKLGFSWRFFGESVEIFHTELEIWNIYAPPITAQWQASVGLSGSVQGGVGGSTLQAQDQVVVSMDTADFWNQLEMTVNRLLSPAGSMMLNRQSGELAVIDTPQALKRIDEWVVNKNEELSTQVQVHIDLYEIEYTEDAIAGFNFQGTMKEALGKTAAEIELGSDDKGTLWGFHLTHSPNQAIDLSDISLILRDASGGGRVSKLTSTIIRGMNGLPVPVFFGDETSYLERRDVVNDEGLTTVRLVPGKIQDGVALNMIPRVLPNTDRMMLNITVRTTRIKGISRFPANAGPKDPVIQLPDLESRSVLLPVLLRSGETLFVAGLDTSRSSDSDSVGIVSRESKVESRRSSLALLITPHIIRMPSHISRYRKRSAHQ